MKKNSNQATGILDDLSSKLECCRDKVLPLKVFDFAIDSLAHDSAGVRTAACILLCNSCMSVQISALRAISNVAVDFKQHKSLFRQSKCVNIWFCFKVDGICHLCLGSIFLSHGYFFRRCCK
ncbi:armadillo repeat-containing protein 8-like [Dorcoceras hygrometricum]|uniref:Armadillo repeat-containing protein 8-like n=1 Tax=Dorcoceras hygrometricum TaxID=472368 RepID=A0A2Z7D1U7_9LAMI|nr:armadillo repeat-containing protein 8-like [Dorcoceras hygrometricum]